MKRLYTLFTLMLLLSGCSDIYVEESTKRNHEVLPDLSASIEDDATTRTFVEQNKFLRWHEEDMITAFYGNTLNSQYRFNGKTGDNSGTFSHIPSDVLGTGNALDAIYAIYPYDENASITDNRVITLTLPAEQTYAENSFGRGANTMIAVTENLEDTFLSFKNACGYLKLKLYNAEGKRLRTVSIRGNKGEKIAGVATASIEFGDVPTLELGDDATTSITLDCGEDGIEIGTTQETATELWIVVPEVTFENGITISATDTEGGIYAKSTTKEVIIERNAIQPMAALEAVFVDQIPNNQIWYTSVDGKPITISSSQCGQVAQSNVYNEVAGRYEVTFAEDVKSIYNEAFENNTNLLTLTLPGTITYIGTGSDSENNPKNPAFCGNTSLVAFGGPLATPDGLGLVLNGCLYAYASGSESSEFIIPEGVKYIKADFESKNLKSVTIPSSVTSMENSDWSSASAMEAVHISDLEAWCKIVFDHPGNSYDYQNNTNPLYAANNLYLNGELITDLVIPESITTIENHTFRGGSFKSITLHDNITELGIFAFADCDNIEEVSLPKSLKNIKYQAFYDCSSLKNVFCNATTVPSVERWNNSSWKAFQQCHSELKIYIPTTNYRTATGWNEFTSKMVLLPSIPEVDEGQTLETNVLYYTSTDGQIVTPKVAASLGANIVSNTYEDGVGAITFDRNLTTIGEKAFYNCKTLNTITIPASVTSLGNGAFEGCTAIKSFAGAFATSNGNALVIDDALYAYAPAGDQEYVIPENVTSIIDKAFAGCYNLRKLTIPATVTAIGKDSFVGCGNGELIVNCDISATTYDNNFGGMTFTKLTISDEVTQIGQYCFNNCSSLTSVKLPAALTEIGDEAFRGCVSLKGITLPSTLTKFGVNAFYGCTSLTSITIPEGVTVVGGFGGCTALETVVLPNSCTTINGNAFSSTAIANITIPNSVTNIEGYAFGNCANLKSITLPNKLTMISDQLFAGSALESIVIPDAVTSIASEAFKDCKSLQEITLGTGLKSITTAAFSGCTALHKVTINSVITSGISVLRLTSLETIAGPYASEDGRCLIYNNELKLFAPFGITEYTIPDSVTRIGDSAFYQCTTLTDINIPDSVTEIGTEAFYNATSLSSITIPSSVTKIGDWALYMSSYKNSKLEVYLKPLVPPTILSTTFNSSQSGLTIYVPIGALSTYQNANYWKSLSSKIKAYAIEFDPAEIPSNEIWYESTTNAAITPNATDVFGANIVSNTYENGLGIIKFDGDITSIGDKAFYYCSIANIGIPSSVKSIGTQAFYGSNLYTVTIPENIESIGDGAFSDCSNLTRLSGKYATPDGRGIVYNNRLISVLRSCTSYTIPDGVTEIGDYAFDYCQNLTQVTIPQGVTKIGYQSFGQCKLLSEINLPESLTEIGQMAFFNCTALKSINIPEGIQQIRQSTFSACSSLEEVTIPASVTNIQGWAFDNCFKLQRVYCKPTTPPTLYQGMFDEAHASLKIYVPANSLDSYKKKQYWSAYASKMDIYYTPTECAALTIEADDTEGRMTTTTVRYTAVTNGMTFNDVAVSGVTVTGEGISNTFEPNTSTTESIEREVSFTYLGMTATTTITLSPYIERFYTVNFNDAWRLSSVANPDASLYDGVYESNSNYHINSKTATMYINITGYDEFTIYARSNGEKGYDYVNVYDLDSTSTIKYSFSDNKNSGTAIGNYTPITFSNIGGGEHSIRISYRKDSSDYEGTDRGYLIIPKNQ